ncbi:hypothetical protein HYS95_00060 [Candidatus Daviesbacteria bacterium]|nr:hypothetical protein [Candidatus Daviesbacteria bacterium]
MINQKGIVPLFVLIAIGVATLAGGAYAVKNEIIKVNKGKVSLNLSKISNQKQSPSNSPNSESNTKPQQNQDSSAYDAPVFYIKPPVGWIKQEKENKITLTAPDKDKEKVGNRTASLSPEIAIYITKNNSALDDFIKGTKSVSQSLESLEYLSDKKLTINGHEAYFTEVRYTKEGIKMHSASYLFVQNGFEFNIKGGTFDSAWDKRKDAILGSMDSFRFKQETSATQQQTGSTTDTVKTSGSNVIFGSAEETSYRNPYKLKPPVSFSMKEPENWTKSVPSFSDGKNYSVEYDGEEETQTGKNGTVRKSKPNISITMIYKADNNWYWEQSKLKTDGAKEGDYYGKKGYFVEYNLEDYKTGVKSKSQNYVLYEKNYEIRISIVSLESTWDKWYPFMKKIIDSLKFL